MNGGPFYPASVTPESRERGLRDLTKIAGITRAQALQAVAENKEDALYRNEVYTVAVYYDGPNKSTREETHLSIKRNDREPIHDWRDLQEIKNLFCGEEREAVEIYPAESRRVDSANQYHLWVLPDGQEIPFGFTSRFVVEPIKGTLAKQRPFEAQKEEK